MMIKVNIQGHMGPIHEVSCVLNSERKCSRMGPRGGSISQMQVNYFLTRILGGAVYSSQL